MTGLKKSHREKRVCGIVYLVENQTHAPTFRIRDDGCSYHVTNGWFSEKVHQGGWRCSRLYTHLLSIKNSNVDDFHVSVAINI